MTDAPVQLRPMKAKAHCARCGVPLPADVTVSLCPQCELRGALDPMTTTGLPGAPERAFCRRVMDLGDGLLVVTAFPRAGLYGPAFRTDAATLPESPFSLAQAIVGGSKRATGNDCASPSGFHMNHHSDLLALPTSGNALKTPAAQRRRPHVLTSLLSLSCLVTGHAQDLALKQTWSWPGYVRGPALAVTVVDQSAYVLERAQLSILDISRPANPQRVGGIGTYASAVCVSGKYAWLAEGLSLVVVDISDGSNPQRVGRCPISGPGRSLALSGNYACVAEIRSDQLDAQSSVDRGRVELVDITNPTQPKPVGYYDTAGIIPAVAVAGSLAYVAESPGWRSSAPSGIHVLDFGDPANPRRVGGYLSVGSRPSALALLGTQLYVGNIGRGLVVLDITEPASPRPIGDAPIAIKQGLTRDPGGVSLAVFGPHACLGGADGLEVFEITDPANPRSLGVYDLEGEARGIAINGNHAFVAETTYSELDSEYESGGLTILDLSHPPSLERVGGLTNPGWYAQGITVSGQLAYVTEFTRDPDRGRIGIVDLSNPASPKWLGAYDTGGGIPRSVAVSGSFAYAPALDPGLQVLDVSDPTSPRRVGGIDVQASAVAVSGRYLYVGYYGEAGGGLDVMDLENPAQPRRVGRYSTDGAVTGIALFGDHACLANGWAWNSGRVEIVDLSTPANPRKTGSFELNKNQTPRRIAVFGSHAYVWAARPKDCGDGLVVINIRDVANPRRVATYSSDDTCGGHVLAVAGNLAYFAGGRGLEVLDISEPSQPRRVSRYPIQASEAAVLGNYVCVAAGDAGLQVYDLSRARPLVARYTTSGFANMIARSGNHAYLADGSAGLQVFDLRDPAMPQHVGGYRALGGAQGIAVSGNHAYLVERRRFTASGRGQPGGLVVLEAANPASPEFVGACETALLPNSITVSGNHAYVAEGTWNEPARLETIDVSDPANPLPVSAWTSADNDGPCSGLSVSGNHVYLTAWRYLQVLDVSNPLNPQPISRYNTVGDAGAVVILADRAYLSGGGLQILDISDPPSYVCSDVGPVRATTGL